MKKFELFTATTALMALSACGGGSTGPTAVEIAASEAALQIFASGTGDIGDALNDGETLTARSVGAASILRTYDGGSTEQVAPQVQIARNSSGELTLVVDGIAHDFVTADRFVEPGGEVYGYDDCDSGNSCFSLFSWSGEIDEAVASGNGYASAFTYYFETEDSPTGTSGYFVVGTETRDADLPDMGTATFEGYAVVNVVPTDGFTDFGDQRERLRGDVEMNVGFADGTISGVMDNLTYRVGRGSDDPVAGSIIMNEAVFDVNGYRGSLSLDETAQAGFAEGATLDAEYSGAFFGPDAVETGGAISGSTSSADGDANLYGFFIASENE